MMLEPGVKKIFFFFLLERGMRLKCGAEKRAEAKKTWWKEEKAHDELACCQLFVVEQC